MEKKITRRRLLCAGLAIPIVSGCGGGSAGTSAQSAGNGSDATRGTLTLTINFPASRSARAPSSTRASGGFIPLGTRAVLVSVTNTATGANVAPPQLITAPLSGTGSTPTLIPVKFSGLPVGSVTVSAAAFPDAAGKQTAIASGSANTTIVAGATTNVTVPLTLSLAQLSASPDSVLVDPAVTSSAHTATVSASVLDASNHPLQLPIYWLVQDPNIAQVSYNAANPTVATVTGIGTGTTTVFVVEPNSGLHASVNVDSGID